MILIYVHKSSPRLQYVASFIFKELLNTAYAITADRDNFIKFDGVRINYSDQPLAEGEITIPNSGLLWETGIKDHDLNITDVNGSKAFFSASNDDTGLMKGRDRYPFDIFSAAFFLITRYEEYLPHQKDDYGRYHHKNSIAWRENFLHVPLVNIWINNLGTWIFSKHPNLKYKNQDFRMQLTYDVDMAWSYLHKGFLRNAGGTLRSVITFNLATFFERLRVVTGARDPSDIFKWLDDLHAQYSLLPIFFILVAEKNSSYDKNILPSNPSMRKLIERLAGSYDIGLHPSWESASAAGTLAGEKASLEKISGKNIDKSRHHYLHLSLPSGYRELVEAGILHDHTMGYGTTNGFRASVASSFFWYDIEKEQQTKLRIHPFCYMDSNAFYDKRITQDQALKELLYFYNACREVNGTFIPVFHNHMLAQKYWPEVFEEFLAVTAGN